MKKNIGRKEQPRGDYYTVECGSGAHLDQLEQKEMEETTKKLANHNT